MSELDYPARVVSRPTGFISGTKIQRTTVAIILSYCAPHSCKVSTVQISPELTEEERKKRQDLSRVGTRFSRGGGGGGGDRTPLMYLLSPTSSRTGSPPLASKSHQKRKGGEQ